MPLSQLLQSMGTLFATKPKPELTSHLVRLPISIISDQPVKHGSIFDIETNENCDKTDEEMK